MKPGLLELLQIKPRVLEPLLSVETPLSMRFSCKDSRWKWVPVISKSLVGTKPVDICLERGKRCERAQLCRLQEEDRSTEWRCGSLQLLGTCLSVHFTLPPLENLPYNVHSVETSLHWIQANRMYRSLNAPFFQEISNTKASGITPIFRDGQSTDDGLRVICTGRVTARQG